MTGVEEILVKETPKITGEFLFEQASERYLNEGGLNFFIDTINSLCVIQTDLSEKEIARRVYLIYRNQDSHEKTRTLARSLYSGLERLFNKYNLLPTHQ